MQQLSIICNQLVLLLHVDPKAKSQRRLSSWLDQIPRGLLGLRLPQCLTLEAAWLILTFITHPSIQGSNCPGLLCLLLHSPTSTLLLPGLNSHSSSSASMLQSPNSGLFMGPQLPPYRAVSVNHLTRLPPYAFT